MAGWAILFTCGLAYLYRREIRHDFGNVPIENIRINASFLKEYSSVIFVAHAFTASTMPTTTPAIEPTIKASSAAVNMCSSL
jgi:hypothetical protein